MKSLIVFLLLTGLGFPGYAKLQPKVVTGPVFGYTPGAFGVSDGGAATYAIPLVVSPGTCGTAPKLALTYSSQSNNGLLGYGWSLQGLSAITRASKTLAQDSIIAGVSLTSTDRLALDGQRLVPVTPRKRYHEDGAIFMTEQQSFSRIVEHDSTFNGVSSPSYFVVSTKSGLIMEYGHTDDSQITLNGSVPLYWLLNKVTDTKGNYYTLTYKKGNGTGEYYPDHIDYTGNTSSGLVPYCHIVFGYESRPDTIRRWFKGYNLISSSKRLVSVASLFKSDTVRKYRLNYINSKSGVSEMTSITESGSDGSAHTPTRFVWRNFGDQHYKEIKQPGIPCTPSDTLQSIDINADGVMDMVKFPANGNIEIYKGTKDTNNLVYSRMPINIAIPRNANWKYFTGDFNGDGRTDLFFYNENSCMMYINETGSTDKIATFLLIKNPITIPDPVPGSASTIVLCADINGDGRSDLVTVNGKDGTNQVYFSTMIGFQPFQATNNAGNTLLPAAEFNVQGVVPFLADVNGDGLPDVVFYNPKTGETHFYINAGGVVNPFSTTATLINPISPALLVNTGVVNNTLFFQDVNGDGLPDIIFKDQTKNQLNFWLNKGDLSFSLARSLTPEQFNLERIAYSSIQVFLGDFNADGSLDILLQGSSPLETNGNGVHLYLGDGKFNFNQAKFDITLVPESLQFFGPGNFSQKSNSDFCVASYDSPPPTTAPKPSFSVKLYRGRYSYNDLIDTIKSGSGQNYEIRYQYLCDDAIYTKGENSVYPIMDYQASQFVVSRYKTDDGIGGDRSVGYKYAGARVEIDGRGFRGFASIQSTDNNTGTIQVKSFNNGPDSWKYAGSSVTGVLTRAGSGMVVSLTDVKNGLISYDSGSSYYAYVAQSRTRTYELNGAAVGDVVTKQQYDRYGNADTVVTDYGGGYADSLVNQYRNDEVKWQLGRLAVATLYRKSPDNPVHIKSSAFAYDPDGLLNQEISGAEQQMQFQIKKIYAYDVYGNITSAITTAWNGQTEESHLVQTTFDELGRFVTKVTNPLGQTISMVNEPLLGHITQTVNLNSQMTTYQYDGFGRVIRSVLPDGSQLNKAYLLAAGRKGEPANCSYLVDNESDNAPPVIQYYDLLDRQIRTQKTGFHGQPIYTDITYNADGYVAQRSLPYFDGETSMQTNYTFDLLGRPVTITAPDKSVSVISYHGLNTTYANGLQQNKTVVKNARQQLVMSVDADGHALKYAYDGAGNLATVIDPSGNTIRFSYDPMGYKTEMIDPDLGKSTYVNNGFGEVIGQTNAAGQTVSTGYDLLGRPKVRTEKEGNTAYTYDDQGTGLLSGTMGYNGYSKSYTYDAAGRVVEEDQAIKGKTYRQKYAYNRQNQLDIITYPSGFSVKRIYNRYGYLSQISNNARDTVYWTADSLNAIGQIVLQHYGNGIMLHKRYDERTTIMTGIQASKGHQMFENMAYEYDVVGNMLSRQDSLIKSGAEQFGYDHLNRLTSSEVARAVEVTVAYDAIGNIIFKSDVGTYNYDSSDPHKLVSVTKAPTYGGQTQPAQWPDVIEYNSLGKVDEMDNGAFKSVVDYNADQQRDEQELFYKHKLVKTKIYINQYMEQDITGKDTVTSNFIDNPEGVFAILNTDSHHRAGGPSYCYRDNLGSLIMTTDQNGQVTGRFNFDAWGKRRNADWTVPLRDKESLPDDRGYTGQESDDWFNVIDMNGRLYDPVSGRFTTPDPSIQDLTDLQDLNRYSYTLNNPLRYVDPTGYFSIGGIISGIGGAIGGVVGTIGGWIGGAAGTIAGGFSDIGSFAAHVASVSANWVGQNWQTVAIVAAVVVITVVTDGAGISSASLLGSIETGAAVGFAASAVTTLAAGGNIGEALSAGIRGAVFGGITAGATFEAGELLDYASGVGDALGDVASHGIVQGLANVSDGGKFINGFFAGGINSIGVYAGDYLPTGVDQVITAAIIGGTESDLNGEKFANGAASAAFGELYNEAGGDGGAFGQTADAIIGTIGDINDDISSIRSIYSVFSGGLQNLGYFGYATLASSLGIDGSSLGGLESSWNIRGAVVNYASSMIPDEVIGITSDVIGTYNGALFNLLQAAPLSVPAIGQIPAAALSILQQVP